MENRVSRKVRKKTARSLKYFLELPKIPDAKESTIRKLAEQARYKSEYERYADSF